MSGGLLFRVVAFLLFGGLLSVSCAASKASSPPREAPEESAPVEPTSADESAANNTVESAPSPPAAQTSQESGPIDLGFEDDGSSGGAPIIINRPQRGDDATELGDLSQEPGEEALSVQYDQVCESVDDCEGLEPPDCAGEMRCAEEQCAFICDEDEGAGDESTGDEDLAADEDVEEPSAPDASSE